MRRDAGSVPYLQRKDYALKKSGFAVDMVKQGVKRDAERAVGPAQSIKSIVAPRRE